MTMKSPKKPKMSKLPKKPKASASVTSWERYHAKVKDVQKANAAKISDYKKKVNGKKKADTKKAQLIKKSQNLGALPGKR